MNEPDAWQVEQAMSAWYSARSALLHNDPDLAQDEAALAELLGPEDGEIRDILFRLTLAIQHTELMEKGAAEMMANLKLRLDRYKNRREGFRGTAFAIMDALNERKIEFPHCTLSISAGRITAEITDENALSDRFVTVKTVRVADKAAILSALKDGEVIEGAALSNGLPVLTIRKR